MDDPNDEFDGRDWLEAELADTLDEDYELEISEPALSMEIRKIYRKAHPPSIPRMDYFRALLRLQSELIKLQDWVAHSKDKIVVIFEGRDSAGKGGVIKRITQRLNPRVARVVALPAPSDREKTPVVLPALRRRTCPPAARSCSSTAPGTIAPGSSG